MGNGFDNVIFEGNNLIIVKLFQGEAKIIEVTNLIEELSDRTSKVNNSDVDHECNKATHLLSRNCIAIYFYFFGDEFTHQINSRASTLHSDYITSII